MVAENSHGLPEIKIDSSHIKISGSQEARTLMDQIHTKVGLELNYDKIFHQAFLRCRDDVWCDFYMGSLASLLNEHMTGLLIETNDLS